jgi:hypothetical protein
MQRAATALSWCALAVFTAEAVRAAAASRVADGWETQFHIDPTGAKMEALAEALSQLGATSADDGVFVGTSRRTRTLAFSAVSERPGFASHPHCRFLELEPASRRRHAVALLHGLFAMDAQPRL